MGATDVLPYPRRRSSVQLKPIVFRLPGEVDNSWNDSSDYGRRSNRSSISENTQSTFKPNTPSLSPPLRVLPSELYDDGQIRSKSSEFRARSHSLHRVEQSRRVNSRRPSIPNERPHEARRRFGSDNVENTAQFIERIRRELLAQLHAPSDFK